MTLLEIARRRALEVLERGVFHTEMHLYRNPIDAQWLGTGLGLIVAEGWARDLGWGQFEITDTGRARAALLRLAGPAKFPEDMVPTKLRSSDAVLLGITG